MCQGCGYRERYTVGSARREHGEHGGLISYGNSSTGAFRQGLGASCRRIGVQNGAIAPRMVTELARHDYSRRTPPGYREIDRQRLGQAVER